MISLSENLDLASPSFFQIAWAILASLGHATPETHGPIKAQKRGEVILWYIYAIFSQKPKCYEKNALNMSELMRQNHTFYVVLPHKISRIEQEAWHFIHVNPVGFDDFFIAWLSH